MYTVKKPRSARRIIGSLLISIMAILYIVSGVPRTVYRKYIIYKIGNGIDNCDASSTKPYLDKLYSLEPNNPETHFTYGLYYYLCKRDYLNAAAHFELSPYLEEVRDAHLYLCYSYLSLDRLKKTENCLKRHFAIHGNDPEAIFLAGMLEYTKGNLEKAYEYVEQAYYLVPNCRNLAYLVEIGHLIGDKEIQMHCIKLHGCDRRILSQYPLEDFVYKICFDDENR